ncbi:TPA: amidohydrolase [Raoultella ornithinolytica]|nr:amidohydrolase [Raoultella ornithinolytica]HAT1671185.1 amidohydrolase [Raoultella ornithinolytica]
MNIIPVFNEWYTEISQWRHDLHKIPETGFALTETSNYIANKLTEWNIVTDRRFGGSGVVGIIDGKQGPGRSIAFRAEMDALPMNDESGKAYASLHEGCSHACGHDGHMAIALATARYLVEHNDFAGRVIFLFQPAEEIGVGAMKMMDDGVFNTYPYEEVYGFHNMPRLPSKTLSLRYGPITGASDRFLLKVNGHSGHSSVPHLCINPITLMSQIITNWQSIVSECVPSAETGILSVTKINAGDTFNAIPEVSIAGGTIRYFEKNVGDILKNKMTSIAHGIASAYNSDVSLHFEQLCSATVNTKEQTDYVIDVARQTFGANRVDTQVLPSPGGEDMSFFKANESVGSCFFMIGSEGENLHTVHFDFDDTIIPLSVTMLVRIAQGRLNKLN